MPSKLPILLEKGVVSVKTRNWKAGISLAAAITIVICVLATSAFRTASDQEIDQIREALIGSQEIVVQMGMFSSGDGTTATLSQEMLESTAENFDQRVDQYYSQGTYANTFYKWLNRDCLFRSHQTTVDNCIAGGVSRCDITNVSLSDNGTEATVSATIVSWNKWVTQEEDGKYTISNPINQDMLEVVMVKEQGTWKLKEDISILKGMTGYDPSSSPSSLQVQSIQQASTSKNAEKVQIMSKIKENKAILAKKYDTFQEAKAAVEGIDVTTGNYLALTQYAQPFPATAENVT